MKESPSQAERRLPRICVLRPSPWGKLASSVAGLPLLLGLAVLGGYCARIGFYPSAAGSVLDPALLALALSFGWMALFVLGMVSLSGLALAATTLPFIVDLLRCRQGRGRPAESPPATPKPTDRVSLYLADWVRWLDAELVFGWLRWVGTLGVTGLFVWLYAKASNTSLFNMFMGTAALGSLPLVGRSWWLRRREGLPAAGPITFTLVAIALLLTAVSVMNPGVVLEAAAYKAGLRGPAGVTLYLRRDHPAARGLMAKGWATPLEPDLAVMALPDLRIVWQGPGEELALQWREAGRPVRAVLPKAAVVATVQAERRGP